MCIYYCTEVLYCRLHYVKVVTSKHLSKQIVMLTSWNPLPGWKQSQFRVWPDFIVR